MFALYYINPTTGERLACTSSKRMSFDREAAPALFAQKENIEKCLRDYKRSAIAHYLHVTGYDTYIAKDTTGRKLEGASDLSLACFRIVPVAVVPDFSGEYTYTID